MLFETTQSSIVSSSLLLSLAVIVMQSVNVVDGVTCGDDVYAKKITAGTAPSLDKACALHPDKLVVTGIHVEPYPFEAGKSSDVTLTLEGIGTYNNPKIRVESLALYTNTGGVIEFVEPPMAKKAKSALRIVGYNVGQVDLCPFINANTDQPKAKTCKIEFTSTTVKSTTQVTIKTEEGSVAGLMLRKMAGIAGSKCVLKVKTTMFADGHPDATCYEMTYAAQM